MKNKESFLGYIKNVENKETKLLKLQKQFRSGQIKEEELTQEQIISLCDLYDKQIDNLRKLNEDRKSKIMRIKKTRKKSESENKKMVNNNKLPKRNK